MNEVPTSCDDTTVIEENLAECRTCLAKVQLNSGLFNLFEAWTLPWDGMEATVADDLIKITNIQIYPTDRHSKLICQACYSGLLDACDFATYVKKNDDLLQQRYAEIDDTKDIVWPKPIQIDKNVNGNILSNAMDVEVKQEVVSDTEFDMTPLDNYQDEGGDVEIKIEPEEIVAPLPIQVTVNGTISLEKMNQQEEVETNSDSCGSSKCYLEDVKAEPLSESEESEIDLPLECMLCAKTFSKVSGLKAHVIAHHSYKTVRRKSSNIPSPLKIEHKYTCQSCKRSFQTQTDLMVHETCHNNYACYGCNAKFDTFVQLSEHRTQCKHILNKHVPKLKTLEDVKRMSRRKERKIGKHKKDDMILALRMAETGISIRTASMTTKIPYTTLRRYVKKKREHGDDISLVPRYDINKVFSEEHEQILLKYYKDCALMFYGLTVEECRKVAYEMAKLNGIKIPTSWERDHMAGLEWFRSFRNRHPDITVKKPEVASLTGTTPYNRDTAAIFLNNLKEVLKREPRFADGARIFNLDETSTTTDQHPQELVAPVGAKLGKVTRRGKGTLVTTCCMVSATGYALPPALIFPRKKFEKLMMHGAPPGSLGLANRSGWMTSDLFVEIMKHFIKCSSTTPENPSLLIMDNHESHLSIEALDLAKQSGVVILTLHTHTTHKLQPLDVDLMGSLKTYYYSALQSWMLQNQGKPATIYEIASFIGHAYPRSMSPLNITSAFAKCGIFPYKKDIFPDEDYIPSGVTDRPASVVPQKLPDAEVSEISHPDFQTLSGLDFKQTSFFQEIEKNKAKDALRRKRERQQRYRE